MIFVTLNSKAKENRAVKDLAMIDVGPPAMASRLFLALLGGGRGEREGKGQLDFLFLFGLVSMSFGLP